MQGIKSCTGNNLRWWLCNTLLVQISLCRSYCTTTNPTVLDISVSKFPSCNSILFANNKIYQIWHYINRYSTNCHIHVEVKWKYCLGMINWIPQNSIIKHYGQHKHDVFVSYTKKTPNFVDVEMLCKL